MKPFWLALLLLLLTVMVMAQMVWLARASVQLDQLTEIVTGAVLQRGKVGGGAVRASDLLLTDRLDGESLEAVNRVLFWHGIAEVGPCTIGDVFQRLTPMEAGRYCHILGEIVDALREVEVDELEPTP